MGEHKLERDEKAADEAHDSGFMDRLDDLFCQLQIQARETLALVRELRQQRDQMMGALIDLKFGAEMLLAPPLDNGSAFARYAREVKRIAEEGLK